MWLKFQEAIQTLAGVKPGVIFNSGLELTEFNIMRINENEFASKWDLP